MFDDGMVKVRYGKVKRSESTLGWHMNAVLDKLIPVCSDEANLIISDICLGRMF